MPYPQTPSPVAPEPSSRLWTANFGGAAAVALLLGLAVFHRDLAVELVGAAGLVAGVTWLANRPPSRPAARPPAATMEDCDKDLDLQQAVFEALPDPVLVIAGGEMDDIAGRRVLLANKVARDLLRIQGQGALLVSVLRDPEVLEAIDEALFGALSRSVAYQSAGAQGRHWRAVTCPLASADAGPLALVVLRDETDVRRTELMRVDFLANASHELRTPLASLSGFIETLKGHARDDPAARDRFLDIMAAQADRMSRLVADLLSLSRIELNEHIAPAGRVDLRRAVADVVDALSVLAQDRDVQVLMEDGADVDRINGDRDEILQVIQNLVDNAIKYSPRGGTVEIAVRGGLDPDAAVAGALPGGTRLALLTPDHQEGAAYCALSVRDHGPGMAREHLPRLTERFYRVEGQKSGERAGTGLGLAIVKHIANRHRGGLAVESASGQGAIFTAYFPAAARRAARPAP